MTCTSTQRKEGNSGFARFAAICLLTALLLSVQLMSADSGPTSPRAVARLSLDGSSVRSMALHDTNGHASLYLFEPAQHRIVIIDVSDPSQPSTEARYQEGSGLMPIELRMMDNSLALVLSSPEDLTQRHEARPGSVSLLDLSNPSEPRVEQQFTNVQAYLVDETAGLLYVVTPRHLAVFNEPSLMSIGVRNWYDALNAR